MRAISTIYRRELGSYLGSFIGYLVAAVMLLACGLLFQTQALGKEPQLSADVLKQFFRFCSGCVIFAGLALSIRLVSEERQQNTIVLLNTSPIRDYEIVVGKFLASWTFLAMTILATIYMPMLIKVNGKVSSGEIFAGYVGLILLGGAVLAIGIFSSSLFQHLIAVIAIAIVITLCMCLLFPLGRELDEPLKNFLFELDLWHVHFGMGSMKGVLNLKDIVYYLAVIYFFLLLSTKTLEAKRWR